MHTPHLTPKRMAGALIAAGAGFAAAGIILAPTDGPDLSDAHVVASHPQHVTAADHTRRAGPHDGQRPHGQRPQGQRPHEQRPPVADDTGSDDSVVDSGDSELVVTGIAFPPPLS